MMIESFSFRCAVSHDNRLFGVITAVAVMLLPTVSAVAQDAPAEKERDRRVRVGFHISGRGLVDNISGPWWESIKYPDDDVMPYPEIFWSINVDRKYQGFIGLGKDGYGQPHEHNETITILGARYNHYLFRKVLYVFGGGTFRYFNKKKSFSRYECTDIKSITSVVICNEGAQISVDIKTDRPNGKSIRFGITTGLGIEYTLFGFLVLSHEVEIYSLPSCSYKEFMCSVSDLKFLGLHLEF